MCLDCGVEFRAVLGENNDFDEVYCPKCKSDRFEYCAFDNTGVSALFEIYKKLQILEEKVDAILKEEGIELTNREVN